MVSLLRRELKTIVIVVATAALTAGAPALADGVRHALFAHNADKVDGKHAVSSKVAPSQAKGRLVAAGPTGKFASKFIPKVGAAVNADKLAGMPGSGYQRDHRGIVTVAKSGGDFTSIQAAIDSISDASISSPYLVFVAPGDYHEHVVLKPHVTLAGSGPRLTRVVVSVEDGAAISQAGVIRDLAVVSTTLLGGLAGVAIQGQSVTLDNVTAEMTSAFVEEGFLTREGNVVEAQGFLRMEDSELYGDENFDLVAAGFEMTIKDSTLRGGGVVSSGDSTIISDSTIYGELQLWGSASLSDVDLTHLFSGAVAVVDHSIIRGSLTLVEGNVRIGASQVPLAEDVSVAVDAVLLCAQSYDADFIEVPPSCYDPDIP